jgi:ATP-binding cassette subfamily F protein 3
LPCLAPSWILNKIDLGANDRNGCGKSTVLQALADRLIPGIPPSLKIHIVSQVEAGPETEAGDSDKGERKGQTALQRVLDGHVERTKALREKAGKTSIIGTNDAGG